MHFGLLMFSTDHAIHPAEIARAAEERGFESLLFPEHTHIPASRRSPWPGGPDLPKDYWHTNDPFVALAIAAAVTTRLKVGTGICLVVERDPITLAKEVATLDSLSGGRVLFGIGGGWNAEEMENHGTNFKRRWSILREKVEAMKVIWTQDEPEYHGEHVNFDKLWSWPKPAQKPHPPILLGSASERGLQRVIDYCDGWLPIPARADVAAGIKSLRARAEAAGRDPRSISVTVFGAPADEQRLDSWRSAGVDRVCFSLPAAGRDEVLPLVDRYAEVARKLA
ncbi:MAG TPA: LLM class F420-dependent oxidoreductase [Candidatus Bathyarchaeia archaeon]|nr:LLM class F420-dependent oxidoreductase [Candidatus Bathyarchaeia archaeon]